MISGLANYRFLAFAIVILILPVTIVADTSGGGISGSGISGSDATSGREAFLQVRSTKLRTAPEPFAPGNIEVHYGDLVTVLEERDGWAKVRNTQGMSGYIHLASLSAQKVELKGRPEYRQTKVAPSEVVLAGKGWGSDKISLQGAKSRKEQSGLSGAAALSYLDSLQTSESEIRKFLANGKLSIPVVP